MALTAEQILAADDLGLLKVNVKEWGGEVFIRVMTVGELDAYQKEWVGKKEVGVDNFRAKFLARCLCDDKGLRLFTDEQIEQLAAKSAKVVGRLFDKAASHNAITEKDVEELAKN
jgi:hypothetical protein